MSSTNASVSTSSAYPPGVIGAFFPHRLSRGPGISLPQGIWWVVTGGGGRMNTAGKYDWCRRRLLCDSGCEEVMPDGLDHQHGIISCETIWKPTTTYGKHFLCQKRREIWTEGKQCPSEFVMKTLTTQLIHSFFSFSPPRFHSFCWF